MTMRHYIGLALLFSPGFACWLYGIKLLGFKNWLAVNAALTLYFGVMAIGLFLLMEGQG